MDDETDATEDITYRDHPQRSVLTQFQNTLVPSLLGIILVFCGSYAIFWNEGRAIKTSMALEEGLREIVIPETLAEVQPENDGELVLVGGPLIIDSTLRDDYYGVQVKAAKLRKNVEMYQWKEKEHTKKRTVVNADGEQVTHVDKTYSYHRDWYDYHIDSSTFNRPHGHQNPPRDAWPAESRTETNTGVRIGGYSLGPGLTDKITRFQDLPSYELPSSVWAWVQLYQGVYYHTHNLLDVQVGDYRVHFTCAGREGDEFTIVGKQANREIVPYLTHAGEELFILHTGLRDAGSVFLTEQHHNRTWTWIYRLLGWFPIFLGLCCLSSLLELILDLYPVVRSVVSLGTTSLPFSVSVSLTLTIIGLGWSWYRPLVGLALLVMGLLPYMIPLSRLLGDTSQGGNRAHGD